MMSPSMDEFVIEGKARLQGTVTPSGNKNAAFPLIAAALLTDEPVRLRNLPDITDVRTMLSLVEGLGARIEFDEQLVLRGRPLRGADILLDEASVTATENVVLAATLAEGTTVLRNAACEPHVQETCQMLTAMGARIDGVGSNLLRIHGV